MPKVDITKAKVVTGSRYPEPFKSQQGRRERRPLGNMVGLSQYGVNHVTLQPGAMSSLKHWHENEDEFCYVLSGELTLIEDNDETILKTGDSCGWKAGIEVGHHLVNKSDAPASYLEIGTRAENERGHYPDDDLTYEFKGATREWIFAHKDGTPYKEE